MGRVVHGGINRIIPKKKNKDLFSAQSFSIVFELVLFMISFFHFSSLLLCAVCSFRLRKNSNLKSPENTKKGQRLIEKETMETGQVYVLYQPDSVRFFSQGVCHFQFLP